MIESQGWKPLGVCSACSAETSLLSWTVIIKQIKSRALYWHHRETSIQYNENKATSPFIWWIIVY